MEECTPPGAFPAPGKATSFISFQPITSLICQFQRFAKDKICCSTAINRLLRAIGKYDQIQSYSKEIFLHLNKQFPRLLILITAFTFNPLPPGSKVGCKTMFKQGERKKKKSFTFEQQLATRFNDSLVLSTNCTILRDRASFHHQEKRMHLLPPQATLTV